MSPQPCEPTHTHTNTRHTDSHSRQHTITHNVVKTCKDPSHHYTPAELMTGYKAGPQKICWISSDNPQSFFISNHTLSANSVLIRLTWRFGASKWCHSVTLLCNKLYITDVHYCTAVYRPIGYYMILISGSFTHGWRIKELHDFTACA